MEFNTVNVNINSINFFESLILAQDERWRRALSMQVERDFESQDLNSSGGRVSTSREHALFCGIARRKTG